MIVEPRLDGIAADRADPHARQVVNRGRVRPPCYYVPLEDRVRRRERVAAQALARRDHDQRHVVAVVVGDQREDVDPGLCPLWDKVHPGVGLEPLLVHCREAAQLAVGVGVLDRRPVYVGDVDGRVALEPRPLRVGEAGARPLVQHERRVADDLPRARLAHVLGDGEQHLFDNAAEHGMVPVERHRQGHARVGRLDVAEALDAAQRRRALCDDPGLHEGVYAPRQQRVERVVVPVDRDVLDVGVVRVEPVLDLVAAYRADHDVAAVLKDADLDLFGAPADRRAVGQRHNVPRQDRVRVQDVAVLVEIVAGDYGKGQVDAVAPKGIGVRGAVLYLDGPQLGAGNLLKAARVYAGQPLQAPVVAQVLDRRAVLVRHGNDGVLGKPRPLGGRQLWLDGGIACRRGEVEGGGAVRRGGRRVVRRILPAGGIGGGRVGGGRVGGGRVGGGRIRPPAALDQDGL